jgi:5-methylcytosine-specific restriction endonuclease McrA
VEADCACETLAVEPDGLSPAALGDLLRRLGRVRSRADAHRAEAIAEAERVGAARQQGFCSTSEWLAALTGESMPVVRSQIAVASALEAMPETRKAFAAGEVSESRVKVLAQAQALCPDQFAEDETSLVARVAAASSQQVPKVLAEWKNTTNPQAAEAEAERLHELRALHVAEDWSGMLVLHGLLDPDSGLVVRHALEALADPANLDPADTRTPAQARADALVEICRRFLQGGQTGRRHPARVLVTIPWNTLQSGKGLVDTEVGPIGAQTARRLTCDATVSRVVLDPQSVPIEMGRATRVIPDRMRRLLETRDGGCTHQGCQIPARWCEAHHIVHWAEGGKTDLANLRLLCRVHHRTAHNHQPHPQRQ